MCVIMAVIISELRRSAAAFRYWPGRLGKRRHHRCGSELLPLTVTNNWYREHRPNPRPLLDWIWPLGLSCRSLGGWRGGYWRLLLSQEADLHHGNPEVITDSPFFTRPSAHKSARPRCVLADDELCYLWVAPCLFDFPLRTRPSCSSWLGAPTDTHDLM